MARFEMRSSPDGPLAAVVAETDAERELIAYGQHHQQGTLVLDGAYYPVRGELVLVPQTLSDQGARRVCEALERSAASHQVAQQRRGGFTVLNADD